MNVQHLDTPAAGTWARDCELIELSDSRLSNNQGFKIIYHRDEDNTYWNMRCDKMVAYKIIIEELSLIGYLINLPIEGAFYEISDSPWINELAEKSKIIKDYKHYVLRFYEETVEFIALNITFEQLKEKPENSPY